MEWLREKRAKENRSAGMVAGRFALFLQYGRLKAHLTKHDGR